MYKFEIFALTIACLAAVAVCDSRERVHYRSYLPVVAPAPAPAPRYAAPASASDEAEPAKYQFAYQLKAGGPIVIKKAGYGSDSGEQQLVQGPEAEFGHAETRDDDNAQGKYFVQLPDGRLQTVTYTVNGDDGYVATVTYSGGDDAAPAPAPAPAYGRY